MHEDRDYVNAGEVGAWLDQPLVEPPVNVSTNTNIRYPHVAPPAGLGQGHPSPNWSQYGPQGQGKVSYGAADQSLVAEKRVALDSWNQIISGVKDVVYTTTGVALPGSTSTLPSQAMINKIEEAKKIAAEQAAKERNKKIMLGVGIAGAAVLALFLLKGKK